MKEADKLSDRGEDKMAYMMVDYLFDDIPSKLRQEVKDKINTMEFPEDSMFHEFKFE